MRRIIETMVVEVGSVIPSDVYIVSASTTPNGRIALIVERNEWLEDAVGDEVWTEEEVADFVDQSDEELDSELAARGLIYESLDDTEEIVYPDYVDGQWVDVEAAAQG